MKLPDRVAELERIATDDSDLAAKIKASQELTELLAALITGREKPLFTRVRIGREIHILDSHDRQELERQASLAQAAIAQCPSHTKSIKCACLDQFRSWYWRQQEAHPHSSLTAVAGHLWDRVEAYSKAHERASKTDTLLETMAAMVTNLAERNDGFPDWFGRRKTK